MFAFYEKLSILFQCFNSDYIYADQKRHIHRADFHRGLLKCSTNLNIKIHLAHRVTCIDPFLSSLTVANSQTFNADLIIASDGLKSVARSVVVGGPSPPVPTGQMVYRVTLPTKKLEGITELQELITIPRNNHWIGPHGTVLSYLLEGVNERLLNLVFTCDSRMEEGADQKVGTAEEVREAFNGWDSRIGQVLEHVENVIEWRVCPVTIISVQGNNKKLTMDSCSHITRSRHGRIPHLD